MPISLVIHGGAGTIGRTVTAAYQTGLQQALEKGFKVLEKGGHASKAVMCAVMCMEDNPDAFNAGTGSAPTRDGTIECDAAIMLSDGSAGAVAAISKAQNPIAIANKVRTDTPHVMLAGAGADALVKKPIDNASLLTERMQAKLERWHETKAVPDATNTVGAVAIDQRGMLAAATSTGGVLGQWAGRIGDTPIIGAGTFADDVVAISCTGKGESFMRAVAAKTIALRVHQGERIDNVMHEILHAIHDDGGHGGVISVKIGGQVCVAFNSPMMAYGWKTLDAEEVNVCDSAGVYGLHLPQKRTKTV